eukprot:2513029-Rhodomonas_salina.1
MTAITEIINDPTRKKKKSMPRGASRPSKPACDRVAWVSAGPRRAKIYKNKAAKKEARKEARLRQAEEEDAEAEEEEEWEEEEDWGTE